MHPSHAPFLNAIKAAPDDDAPRLVFADWLEIDGPEEQRDAARAELIRTQCELARLLPPGRHSDGRRQTPSDIMRLTHLDFNERKECADRIRKYENLEVLADAILSRFGMSWFPGPGDFVRLRIPVAMHGGYGDKSGWGWSNRGDTTLAEVRRGFLESLTIRAADWLAHGDAILAEHPVREVRLTTLPEWRELARLHINSTPEKQRKRVEELHSGTTGSVSWAADSPERVLRLAWPGVTFRLP